MSQNENEIDIGPMLNDINKVLKGHLTNLLGPIINEKNAIRSVLLNMPYVKKLKQENNILKTKIFQLKTELESTKKFYNKELENASKKNVKLEVRDSLSNLSETPSKIVELKREMWRKNEKVNSQDDLDDDDESEEDEYNNLYGEEDEDEEEEDDEEYESPIITNCRMSLQNNENNVEITSNGTVESDANEDIKNVTVWNLNKESQQNVEQKEEDDRTFWTEIEKNVKVENNDCGEEEAVDEEEKEDEEEDEDDDEDEEEDEEDDDEDEEDDEEQDDDEEDEEEEDDGDGVEEDDEEELDVEDVEIDGVQYLTTSTENGEIYKCDEDGEIVEDENGDFVICGYFKEGIANFI